jgi:hypothetical protein
MLTHAVSKFIDSCGREYEFPAGGTTPFLTDHEFVLLNALTQNSVSDREAINTLSRGLEWSGCYSLTIFGNRLAIFGVRSNNSSSYQVGIRVLAAASPRIDFRDALGAFAIFEYCGTRLGIDFQTEIESVMAYTNEEKLRPTLEGFLLRENEMRTVNAMGLEQAGEGEEMTFRPRYSI